jgi:choline dehydrogenase
MKPIAGKEIDPEPAIQTHELYEKYIESKIETAYHPSYTLKMGIDDMVVVDKKLKVHGIENLRGVDASAMPEIISGNPNHQY